MDYFQGRDLTVFPLVQFIMEFELCNQIRSEVDCIEKIIYLKINKV